MQAIPTRHRLSVNDFHRMVETGILSESERIELIEGELFDMSPIGPLHCGTTMKLNYWFSHNITQNVIVNVQNALILDNASELYPDMTLLRWREDFYTTSHPRCTDVLLLIEIADTSIGFDRYTKMPLYAQHGIVESWLLDVQQQQLEIYRAPTAQGYQTVLRPSRDEQIMPQQLPDLIFNVGVIW